MRGVVSQSHRCRSTTKTVPHLGHPYVVKAGSNPRFASCCPATQLTVSPSRVAHRTAIAVGLRRRPSPILGNPTRQSLGHNITAPRSVFLFSAVSRHASRPHAAHRHRCRSTNKTVPHPGQPFVVKPRSQHRLATLRPSLFRTAVLLHAPRRHAVRRIAIVLGSRAKP